MNVGIVVINLENIYRAIVRNVKFINLNIGGKRNETQTKTPTR